MNCPHCFGKSHTVETRHSMEGNVIRKRSCNVCWRTFLTRETHGEPGLKMPVRHNRRRTPKVRNTPISADGAELQAFMQSTFR